MAKKKEEKIVEEEVIETPVEIVEAPVETLEKPVLEEGEYYFVRIGETLKDVAEKFNTSVEKLNELNNNPELIGTNQIRVK